MIDLVFTSFSDAVNATRVGNVQRLTVHPDEFEPVRNINKVTAYSFRGNAKKTTILGKYDTISISIPYLEDAQYIYFKEFVNSVDEEQIFTIDPTDMLIAGVEGFESTYTVFIPDSQLAIPRFNECNGFVMRFNVRTVIAESE